MLHALPLSVVEQVSALTFAPSVVGTPIVAQLVLRQTGEPAQNDEVMLPLGGEHV